MPYWKRQVVQLSLHLHVPIRSSSHPQQLTDKQLKGMLEQISDSGDGAAKQKIQIDRRRFNDDSDSEPDLDGL